MSEAFVGPPRDLQPPLWDRTAEPPKTAKGPEKAKTPGTADEEKLSKRIRAVAIGSAGGILLSLVVQSFTPGKSTVRRTDYRRQVIQVPVELEPEQSDFSLGSLGTGLVVGLGTGLILGSNSADETDVKPKEPDVSPGSLAHSRETRNAPRLRDVRGPGRIVK